MFDYITSTSFFWSVCFKLLLVQFGFHSPLYATQLFMFNEPIANGCYSLNHCSHRLFLRMYCLNHCYRRLLLRHCFQQLRSTQVAVIHCSAQTNPSHVLQKLGQMCIVISSNTGRVYRPKDCERLILYLKDLNLPKPDKWGTSQLIAFLHQVYIYMIVLAHRKR